MSEKLQRQLRRVNWNRSKQLIDHLDALHQKTQSNKYRSSLSKKKKKNLEDI